MRIDISLRCDIFYLRVAFVLVSLLISIPENSFSQEKSAVSGAHQEKIHINLIDADIATFAKFISKISGKNFIYDETFSGKVTILAPSLQDTDEAFDLFVSVLKLKGYTIVLTGSVFKIMPISDVRQGAVEVYTNGKEPRRNESYIARLIPLQRMNSQDLVPALQPLLSKEGYISAFGKNNNIFIVDNALNVEKVLKIVNLLEISGNYSLELVYLKYSQAESITYILRQIRAGIRPTKQAQDTIGPVADKRLNAVILFGTSEDNTENKTIISMLDVAPPDESTRINVYNLENAEAGEIARVLEGLVKPAPVPSMPLDAINHIIITPYMETNSLIIMASPEDYKNVLSVIKKLDRRPKQVFVEAMITEISINKSIELGTKWRLAGQKDGKPVVVGGMGTVDASIIQNVISGMSGFSIGGLGNFMSVPVTRPDGTVTTMSVPGFVALFSLSEFKGIVDILSTPHILTSDNREAEIVVGENVPFLSKIERETSTLNQPILQSIERKDVGITLRIKPQISEGGYIRLDIYQEISSISPGIQTASDIVTTKRAAKTSVVVKDKQTVVIGGLIQDKEIQTTTKVPLLSDIPLIGWLFKFSSSEKQKTNLLVYLTPSIVDSFDDLDVLKKSKTDEYDENVVAK